MGSSGETHRGLTLFVKSCQENINRFRRQKNKINWGFYSQFFNHFSVGHEPFPPHPLRVIHKNSTRVTHLQRKKN